MLLLNSWVLVFMHLYWKLKRVYMKHIDLIESVRKSRWLWIYIHITHPSNFHQLSTPPLLLKPKKKKKKDCLISVYFQDFTSWLVLLTLCFYCWYAETRLHKWVLHEWALSSSVLGATHDGDSKHTDANVPILPLPTDTSYGPSSPLLFSNCYCHNYNRPSSHVKAHLDSS